MTKLTLYHYRTVCDELASNKSICKCTTVRQTLFRITKFNKSKIEIIMSLNTIFSHGFKTLYRVLCLVSKLIGK